MKDEHVEQLLEELRGIAKINAKMVESLNALHNVILELIEAERMSRD